MVDLAALSITEATARLDDLVGVAVESAITKQLPAKADLLGVYQTLLGVTATEDQPARGLLEVAGRYATGAEPAVVDSLPTRARVAMRLLRLGSLDAAWLVLVDSATGVVRRAFNATTSSGARRTDWPLPLLTAFEAPKVYAELPGFRDPRFAAPDEAYEIGAAFKLRCHVDDVIAGRTPVIAGWAALDVVQTEPDESVTLVAVRDGVEVAWSGVRCRRGDLVGGSRETLRRRAWAGWQVEVSPLDLAEGRWALWLEIGQRGVARRARLGKSVGDLAALAVGSELSDRPLVTLADRAGGWSLIRRSAGS